MTGCTIEEASKLICCQDIASDRGTYRSCRGKICMAWRWVIEREGPTIGPGKYSPGKLIQTDRGYCGLAGEP
jgi:hypothetical protein